MRGRVIYREPDFVFSQESSRGHSLYHCEVFKATPSVLKRCRQAVSLLVAEKKETSYALCEKDNDKLKKFLRFVGFKYERNTWDIDAQGRDRILELWKVDYND